MTSRIRDLTRTYDWYFYHGHINGKRNLQIQSTTSRNGYNHKLCDLRLNGTEWQCGNSTLAMSWPNHVQILSFASMTSHQGAVKHGLISKIAGGCSSYDVIAPWPDLSWSIFFYQKLRIVFPIRYPKTRRRYAPPLFRYLISDKTSEGGGGLHPVRARVNVYDLLREQTSACVFLPSLRASPVFHPISFPFPVLWPVPFHTYASVIIDGIPVGLGHMVSSRR